MKLHRIIIPLAFLFSLNLNAQNINAYLSAGAAISQIEGDELKGFDKWGFDGGVGALIRLNESNTLNLAIETNYARRGSRYLGNISSNPYNINLSLDYVEVPFVLFYHNPYTGMKIGAGLAYGRLFRQPHDTIRFNPSFIPDTSDLTFLKNDISPLIEMRFAVWRGLQFSLRYQFSCIPIKRDWQFTEGIRTWANDCYNSSLTLKLLWQIGEPDKVSKKGRGQGRNHYSHSSKKRRRR